MAMPSLGALGGGALPGLGALGAAPAGGGLGLGLGAAPAAGGVLGGMPAAGGLLGGVAASTGLAAGGLGALGALGAPAGAPALGGGVLGGGGLGLGTSLGLGAAPVGGLGLGVAAPVATSSALSTSLGLGLPGVGLQGLTTAAPGGLGLLAKPAVGALPGLPGAAGAQAAGATAPPRDKQNDIIERYLVLAQQLARAGLDTGSLQQVLQAIGRYYKGNPSTYEFKAITHNIRDPNTQYAPPPLMTPDEWARENSVHAVDEKCKPPLPLVPVVMDGFSGLTARMDWQERKITEFNSLTETLLGSVQAVVASTSKSHDHLERLRIRHQQLSHQLLRVTSKVDAIYARGLDQKPGETEVAQKLQDIAQSSAALKARVLTLITRQRMREEAAAALARAPVKLDDHDLRVISRQMQEQHKGIEQIMLVIRKDERDLKIMREGVASGDGVGSGHATRT